MSVTLFKSGKTKSESEERDDKSDSSHDKFLRALRQANFTTKIIPVLAFEFCSLDILWRELQQHQHYEGLIFTSPRCVQSLQKAVESCDMESQWEGYLKGCWIDKRMFCVGPSTVSEVLKFFSHNSSQQDNKIFVSQQGNSASLGQTIMTESLQQPIALPLLYPCGNLKTDTLGSLLNEKNIPFKTLVVYNTVKSDELERNPKATAAASADKESNIYVFFSPSGVTFASPLLNDVESVKFVAIGPTTRVALENVPSIPKENIYECAAPTPEALVTVLHSLVADERG